MVYRNTNSSDRFGSASRTITLPLSSWAYLAECCESNEIDLKTCFIRAIAQYWAITKKTEREIAQ